MVPSIFEMLFGYSVERMAQRKYKIRNCGIGAVGQYHPTDEDRRRLAMQMRGMKQGEYVPTPEELAAEAELVRFCDDP